MLANSYKVGSSLWGAVVLLLCHLQPLCQVLRQAWPRCNDITLSAAQKEMHHPLSLDGPSAAKKQSRQKPHAFLYKGAQGELLLPLFSKNLNPSSFKPPAGLQDQLVVFKTDSYSRYFKTCLCESDKLIFLYV